MEESTSWKGHGFTLLIFGGIVVLCSIFFVLGMLVGRNQGQRIALAATEESGGKTKTQTAGDLKLGFHTETTEEKPDLKLQPAPDPPRPDPPARTAQPATPARPPAAASDKPKPKPDPEPGIYLQILATKNAKQAALELKKVESKGFKARIVIDEQNKVQWNRVYVGPYKESEVNLAKSDLKAKGGYKDVIVRK
jgi:cell division septation protein DedD